MYNCLIPDIISLTDYNGDYERYEEEIYNIFISLFENENFNFRGMKIVHKRHPEYRGKSATFWHITSDGIKEDERIANLRRYERIQWPFYIINNCVDSCSNLLIWENKRGSDNRVLIWCREIEYLIVLTKRKGYYIFWTSYPVTEKHTKRKLYKEYTEYIAKAAQL